MVDVQYVLTDWMTEWSTLWYLSMKWTDFFFFLMKSVHLKLKKWSFWKLFFFWIVCVLMMSSNIWRSHNVWNFSLMTVDDQPHIVNIVWSLLIMVWFCLLPDRYSSVMTWAVVMIYSCKLQQHISCCIPQTHWTVINLTEYWFSTVFVLKKKNLPLFLKATNILVIMWMTCLLAIFKIILNGMWRLGKQQIIPFETRAKAWSSDSFLPFPFFYDSFTEM